MIREPHAGTSEPFEADMSGLALLMNDSLTSASVDYELQGVVSSFGKPTRPATKPASVFDQTAIRKIRSALRCAICSRSVSESGADSMKATDPSVC